MVTCSGIATVGASVSMTIPVFTSLASREDHPLLLASLMYTRIMYLELCAFVNTKLSVNIVCKLEGAVSENE
jgi:hypothetical protein